MQQIQFDRDVALVVERGREAWRDLRRDETWEKWVAIGRAIDLGRTTIMRHLGTNQPKGRTWSEVFGQWLKENEFDQIDKGVRSRLQTCMENLPAIEAWRANLGLSRRLELNHPNAVLRRWQASAMPKTAAEPKERKASMASLDAAVDRIIEGVADTFERANGAAALVLDLTPEGIDASVETFVEVYGLDPVLRFIEGLLPYLDRQDPRRTVAVVRAFLQTSTPKARSRRDRRKASSLG